MQMVNRFDLLTLDPVHPPLVIFVVEWGSYYFWLRMTMFPSFSLSWYQISPSGLLDDVGGRPSIVTLLLRYNDCTVMRT